jgi:murein tripeptide amidase MpaA
MSTCLRLAGAACAVALALAAPPTHAADTSNPDSLAARVRKALGDTGAPRATPAAALGDSAGRRAAPPPISPPPPPAPETTTFNPNGPPIPADLPGFWRTRAERTGWKQTSDYDETMRYCKQLEAGSHWVRLTSIGTSGQGRDVPLLIVSRDRAFTPEAARATGKPIVLIQNGIHSGEIEGKDASLALVRDMAVLTSRQNLLDSCIVLVLPIYSVDAHERSSPYNRMNQNGPETMGWRTTPLGLNLNRDYMKAEAPETRAWLANLWTRWWPDLLVDDHTTDGADYRHDVTYAYAHGAIEPPSLERWYMEAFEGRVVKRLEAMGHLPAPYLSFRRGSDPLSGIDFNNAPPRFSTSYPGLHGRAAILVETHMLKPYGTRVRATYDLLVALLEELRARPRELRDAVRQAEAGIVARGRAETPAARTLALSTKTSDRSIPFAFLGKVTTWPKSAITGQPVPHYSDAPWDTIIPLYRESVTDLSVQQPAGYLVPREWSRAIELLQLHGVQVRRLARAWSDTVEVQRIAEWTGDPQPSEGHHPITVKRVELQRRLRSWRAGDVWVPLDQRSAPVAVNLCEAQAPDGFVRWNFFDTVLEKKEYGEAYVIEPLARDMLVNDPRLAAEFRAKLAADTSFAGNAAARADFFYRRSAWADPDQDLSPVARALRPVPESVLAPATAAAVTPASAPGTAAAGK